MVRLSGEACLLLGHTMTPSPAAKGPWPIALLLLGSLAAAEAVSDAARPAAAGGDAEAHSTRLCAPPPPPALLTIDPPTVPGAIVASADHASREGALITLQGNAEIAQHLRAAGSDTIRIDRDAQRAELDGAVFLTTQELLIKAERGTLELDTGAFGVDGARYQERRIPAQGRAGRIEGDGERITRFRDTTFSTCPRQQEDWYLSAGDIELDGETRQGTARNVSLRFFGVPLLYSPWLRFPIGDERMTGLLAPRVGQSSRSGIEVATPWYWNAAPNFDATITPVYLQRRGGQLRTQWRWLNPQGQWQLDNEYLPGDRRFGDDRMLTQLQHEGALGRRWTTELDVASASDERYFDDLGDELDLTSRTHLLRRADLEWRAGRSRLRTRVQTYQTLDETIAVADRPYEQLPRIDYETRDHRAGAARFDLDAEAIEWQRSASTTGTRVRVRPALRAPIERPGWFVRPRVALDHTSYRLDRATDDPGAESIDRTLPVTSLDAGLRFDRRAGRFRQTLEPRAFYVHIPREDQDEIPLFDTARHAFRFDQLFRERRFTGGDRIGDDHRLALAVTSRLLERGDGREVLRASLGGIGYFDDREVGLEPGDAAERSTSDLIAEAAFSPLPQWRTEATVQWDPEHDETRRATVRAGYRGSDGGIANLGWRTRRGLDGATEQDQIDASFAWPVSPRWQLLGRLNHSLAVGRNLEALGGVEYNSCCWSVRAIAREYVSDLDESDTSIHLELVLRGLGGVGDDAGRVFERAILGYRDTATAR